MQSNAAFRSRRVLLVALMMVAMLCLGLAAPAAPQLVAAGTSAYVTVKRGVKRTTIKLSGSGGNITKIVTTDKEHAVEFLPRRTGAASVLACSAETRKCSSLLERGVKKLTACACLNGNEKISLAAGGDNQTAADFYRFFGDLDSDGGGGGSEPHCWESEEEQMSICEP